MKEGMSIQAQHSFDTAACIHAVKSQVPQCWLSMLLPSHFAILPLSPSMPQLPRPRTCLSAMLPRLKMMQPRTSDTGIINMGNAYSTAILQDTFEKRVCVERGGEGGSAAAKQ